MFVPTHSYTHGPRYPMNPSTQQQQLASQSASPDALSSWSLPILHSTVSRFTFNFLPPSPFLPVHLLIINHSTFCFTTSTERENCVLPKPTSSSVDSPRSPLDLTCATCDRGSLSSVTLYPFTLKDCLDTRARLTLFLCKNPLDCVLNPVTSVQLVIVTGTLG